MIENAFRKTHGISSVNLNNCLILKYRNEINKDVYGFLIEKRDNSEEIALNHFNSIKGDRNTYLSLSELTQDDANKISEYVSSCPYPPYTDGVYTFSIDDSLKEN